MVMAVVTAGLFSGVILAAVGVGRGTTARPLATAVIDPLSTTAPGAAIAYRHMHALGATMTVILADWSRLAPNPPAAGSDPADPQNAMYAWASIDKQVQLAVRGGLEPVLIVTNAPSWAQSSPPTTEAPAPNPVPAQFATFGEAIAAHYDGAVKGIPRVRYWEVWNEPNLSTFLRPQFHGRTPYSPRLYRSLLEGFAAAVKKVHRDNFVIAGALAPFRDITPSVLKIDKDWGPLAFMRSLFCLSPSLARTCKASIHDVDAWAMHPYTSGGPNHHAVLPNDVSLGDLGKVNDVLEAAVSAGNLDSKPQLWITEFSWDSDPPDGDAVPVNTLKQWVPWALYNSWKAGVSMFTWYLVRDQSATTSPYQSGLYFLGQTISKDAVKPFAEGFRFPFVAFPHGQAVDVWLRTPFGLRGRVQIQQRRNTKWVAVKAATTDRFGILQATVPRSGDGAYRAVLVTTHEKSLAFSLTPPPDHWYNPFGSTGPLEPHRSKSK